MTALFPVKVQGKKLFCLWDTGATTSLISMRFVKRLGLMPRLINIIGRHYIKGLTSEPVRASHSVRFPIVFHDGQERTITCLVCTSVPHDLLIGTPFMHEHNIGFLPKDDDSVALFRMSAAGQLEILTETNWDSVTHSAHFNTLLASTSPDDDPIIQLNGIGKTLNPLLQEAFHSRLTTKEPSVLLSRLLDNSAFEVDESSLPLAQAVLNGEPIAVHDVLPTSYQQASADAHDSVDPSSVDDLLDKDDQWELTSDQRLRFAELMHEFKDLFAVRANELGQCSREEVTIRLKSKEPVVARNYRTPLKFREWLKQQLHDLQQEGVIELSQSPYNSPALVVPKKLDVAGDPNDPTRSQGKRLVVDYRQVNQIIEDANYPMPRVQDLLTHFKGKTVFSSMDIRHAFYTIRLDPESRKVTAFSCEFGLLV